MSKRTKSTSTVLVIDSDSDSDSLAELQLQQQQQQQNALVASEDSLRAFFDSFLLALLGKNQGRHRLFCLTFPFTVTCLRTAWSELTAQSRSKAQALVTEALSFGNASVNDAFIDELEPADARAALRTHVRDRAARNPTASSSTAQLAPQLAGSSSLSGEPTELPICSLHDMDTGTHILFAIAVGNILGDDSGGLRKWAKHTYAWLQNVALQTLRYHQLCLVAHELLGEGLRQRNKQVVKTLLVASPELFRIDILVHHEKQAIFDLLLGTSARPFAEDADLVQALTTLWIDEVAELRPVRHAVHHAIHEALEESGASLYAYQKILVQWVLERERRAPVDGKRFRGGIVALRPGMGKTRISEIIALVRAHSGAALRPTLVLVPVGVIEDWQKENDDALHGSLRIGVLHRAYDVKNAMVSYNTLLTRWLDDKAVDVVMTTVQTLVAKFFAEPPALVEINTAMLGRFGRLIVDEMHLLSNPKSILYKKLAVLVAEIPCRWGLTGTVFRNRRVDVDAQLALLGLQRPKTALSGAPDLLNHVYLLDYGPETADRKERLLSTKEIALDKLEWDLYRQIYDYGKTLYNQGASFITLTGAMTRMRQAAISMDLIPPDAFEEMQGLGPKKAKKQATATGTMFALLGSVTSVFAGWGAAAPVPAPPPPLPPQQPGPPLPVFVALPPDYVSSRMRAVIGLMRFIVKQHPDDKMIVFSGFSSVLEKLKTLLLLMAPEFPWRVGLYTGKASPKKRRNLREAFNTDPAMKALFLTYTAGGAGLNLQVAAHCIEIDPCFNDATLDQAEARIWRIGQLKMVRIYRFLATNTYEMRMEEIRGGKAQDWENMQLAIGSGKQRRAGAAATATTTTAIALAEAEQQQQEEMKEQEEEEEASEVVPMSFMARIFGGLW